MPWIDEPEIYAPVIRATHPDVKCSLNHDVLTIEGSGGFCHLYLNSSLPWQTYDEALYAMARGMVPANVSFVMIPCKGASEPIPWVTLRAGPKTSSVRLQSASTATSSRIELECRAANVSQYKEELKRALATFNLIDPRSGQPVPYVMRRIDWSSVGRAGSLVEAHLEAASDPSVHEKVTLEIRDRLAPALPRLPSQPGIVPERVQCLDESTALGAHLAAHASRIFATSPGDACDGLDVSNDFSWSIHPSKGTCPHHALVRYQWATTDKTGNRNAAHLQVVVQDTTPPQWSVKGVSACIVVASKGMMCVPESAWNEHVRAALSDACSRREAISWNLTPRRRRLCKSISSCSDGTLDWISDACTSAPWFSSNGDYADLEWTVVPRDECGNQGSPRTVRLVFAQHAAQCQRLGMIANPL